MATANPGVWTEERLERLKELWLEGRTITQIGHEIGVTRNAVVGKVHRLGLPKRASPIHRSGKAAEPVLRRVPRLSNTEWNRSKCTWPIGDPQSSEFHFCGDPISDGRPYCEHHCGLAYTTYTRPRTTAVA